MRSAAGLYRFAGQGADAHALAKEEPSIGGRHQPLDDVEDLRIHADQDAPLVFS